MLVDKGRIAERGTHEELLSMGGAYAAMWEKQHKKEHVSEEAET
jgi:ATP-binding cassette subfamily B protein